MLLQLLLLNHNLEISFEIEEETENKKKRIFELENFPHQEATIFEKTNTTTTNNDNTNKMQNIEKHVMILMLCHQNHMWFLR